MSWISPRALVQDLILKLDAMTTRRHILCIDDAEQSERFVSSSSVLSAIDIGSISIITSLDGRGVNLGSVNVQPLTESTNGNFLDPIDY